MVLSSCWELSKSPVTGRDNLFVIRYMIVVLACLNRLLMITDLIYFHLFLKLNKDRIHFFVELLFYSPKLEAQQQYFSSDSENFKLKTNLVPTCSTFFFFLFFLYVCIKC